MGAEPAAAGGLIFSSWTSYYSVQAAHDQLDQPREDADRELRQRAIRVNAGVNGFQGHPRRGLRLPAPPPMTRIRRRTGLERDLRTAACGRLHREGGPDAATGWGGVSAPGPTPHERPLLEMVDAEEPPGALVSAGPRERQPVKQHRDRGGRWAGSTWSARDAGAHFDFLAPPSGSTCQPRTLSPVRCWASG